ncbi:MAG: hypothetical protein ACRDI2_18640, partial [Chloroflexota bacterium]
GDVRVAGALASQTAQLQGPGGPRVGQDIVTRPVAGGSIQVVRALEDRPCTRVPETQATPTGDILYFDPEANAVGIRYRHCRGSSEVVVDTSLNYGRLRSDAEQLLRGLPGGLQSGDILDQISRTVEQTRLLGNATVAVTVSGTLRAELRGTTEQGINAREYQVEGLLRLTPRGWSLELSGEFRHIADELGGQVQSFSFTPRVNIGPVQAGVTVEQTRQQPVGAAPTATTTVRGTVSVATGRGLGVTFSGSSENGGTFFITFGTVDRSQQISEVPKVECYACDCPPPRPIYTCTSIRDPHTVPEVVQTAATEVVQLHYQYDSTEPANPTTYAGTTSRIATLLGQDFSVTDIVGFASPEADVAYNLRLAGQRANRAHADIAASLRELGISPTSPLPAAQGQGELLGAGGTGPGGEARNRELISVLSARLSALSEAEQFELLGIDATGLDEAGREDARRRIRAFIEGTEEGRRLSQRARWERIFPFLRRVEVTLNRPERTEPREVPRKTEPTNCDDETLRWARQNLPALPAGRRIPTESGRC